MSSLGPIDRFLDLADQGFALLSGRETSEAIAVLEQAERTYADVASHDEETARRVGERYAAVVRALGEEAVRRGDHDSAVLHLVRSLAPIGRDAEAYIRLVAAASAAGRHGEARRYYAMYGARMDSVGAPRAPFPGRGRLDTSA